jgi:restriction system protein
VSVIDMDKIDPKQELRDHFIQQAQSSGMKPDQILAAFNGIDKMCDEVVEHAAKNPSMGESFTRTVEGAILGGISTLSPVAPVEEVLFPYIRERLALLEMETNPAFAIGGPHIVLHSLIIPGERTDEGQLVEGVGKLWFEILRRFRDNPDRMYEIDWREWEEIVAGAYKTGGWETVILTPRSGDKGRDVIATRGDWGQLRFLLLDQVKAYGPSQLIGPDEVRQMAGVLLLEPAATKAIITTTSDFTPGAIEVANRLTPRLELKPRGRLLAWLASVMAKERR